MYAARREEEHYEECSWVQLKGLQERTLMTRWMDDVIHVIRGKLTSGGMWALKLFSKKDSYGKDLELNLTDGDEAFGFEWR